jgi:hypothetical protein
VELELFLRSEEREYIPGSEENELSPEILVICEGRKRISANVRQER